MPHACRGHVLMDKILDMNMKRDSRMATQRPPSADGTRDPPQLTCQYEVQRLTTPCLNLDNSMLGSENAVNFYQTSAVVYLFGGGFRATWQHRRAQG